MAVRTTVTNTIQKRTEYCLGIGVTRHGRPIPDDVARHMTARGLELVTRAYGGASITGQIGAWIDPDGKMIREPGITITAFGSIRTDFGPRTEIEIGTELLRIFNQHALYMVVTDESGVNGIELSRETVPV